MAQSSLTCGLQRGEACQIEQITVYQKVFATVTSWRHQVVHFIVLIQSLNTPPEQRSSISPSRNLLPVPSFHSVPRSSVFGALRRALNPRQQTIDEVAQCICSRLFYQKSDRCSYHHVPPSKP